MQAQIDRTFRFPARVHRQLSRGLRLSRGPRVRAHPVAARRLFRLVADCLRGGTEDPDRRRGRRPARQRPPLIFAPIDLTEWGHLVTTATAWHRRQPFDMVQLLWPDRNGFLPYEEGSTPGWLRAAPLSQRRGRTRWRAPGRAMSCCPTDPPSTSAQSGERPGHADRIPRPPIARAYYRYFSARSGLSDKEAERFTNVDMENRAGLVIKDGEVDRSGSFDRWPGRDDADVAFFTDDSRHGTASPRCCSNTSAALATAVGIAGFTAEVLGDDPAVLAVFAKAGWPVRREVESGVVDLSWDLHETPAFLDTLEQREQIGDSRAVAQLLESARHRRDRCIGSFRFGRLGRAAEHDRGRRTGRGLRREPESRKRSRDS